MADIVLEGTSNSITTTIAVRLAAGLDVSEFPDQAFLDAELAEELELDLNEWLGDAGLNYVTIWGLPRRLQTARTPSSDLPRGWMKS